MFKSNKLAVLAALLSLLMLFSAFAVPAFAEDATTAEETTAAETVEETTAAETVEETTSAETEAATTTATTTASTTTASTTAADTSAEAAKKEQRTRGFINLGVGVAILVALAVLCIKFRDKIPTWWKSLKSECGKITWCPKDKLKKNVKVVILIILAIAIAIGALDFAFSRGMILLGDLFK